MPRHAVPVRPGLAGSTPPVRYAGSPRWFGDASVDAGTGAGAAARGEPRRRPPRGEEETSAYEQRRTRRRSRRLGPLSELPPRRGLDGTAQPGRAGQLGVRRPRARPEPGRRLPLLDERDAE